MGNCRIKTLKSTAPYWANRMTELAEVKSGQANYVDALHLELHHTIPLVRALAMQVVRAQHDPNGTQIKFAAALSANINDKGCAFGGSLASLKTLACWSVLRTFTWNQGIAADIFVHTSRVVYIAPIWHDFEVHCALSADSLASFKQSLIEREKAAAILHAEVLCRGELCSTMEARFVAKAPQKN